MTTALKFTYLGARPSSAYRQLFIKGTRIQAEIIYRAHISVEEPRTADQLATDYNLPLEAVREAIEYGRSAPPEIEADMAREEAIATASGHSSPNSRYNPKPKILSPEEWAQLLS